MGPTHQRRTSRRAGAANGHAERQGDSDRPTMKRKRLGEVEPYLCSWCIARMEQDLRSFFKSELIATRAKEKKQAEEREKRRKLKEKKKREELLIKQQQQQQQQLLLQQQHLQNQVPLHNQSYLQPPLHPIPPTIPAVHNPPSIAVPPPIPAARSLHQPQLASWQIQRLPPQHIIQPHLPAIPKIQYQAPPPFDEQQPKPPQQPKPSTVNTGSRPTHSSASTASITSGCTTYSSDTYS